MRLSRLDRSGSNAILQSRASHNMPDRSERDQPERRGPALVGMLPEFAAEVRHRGKLTWILGSSRWAFLVLWKRPEFS